MGVVLERYKKKLEIAYNISGVCADLNQLLRAYMRSDSKGMKKNISQIIKKLEKVKFTL